MATNKKQKHLDCDVLITKCCDKLVALPKTYLSAVKDFDETVLLENLKKPLIGVAQNDGKAVLLADPKFIIDTKRRSSHIPKFLIFLEESDRNLCLQIDEIIGLKTIKINAESLKVGSGKKLNPLLKTKLGRQNLIYVKVDELFKSLIGDQNKIKKETAVDFLKESTSIEERRTFLSFVIENEKFAVDIEDLNRVTPMEDIEIIDSFSGCSVPMANFSDSLCPFIGGGNSKYAFQAFFSSPSENGEARHTIAIGSENKCELHNVLKNNLVRTNKNDKTKKRKSDLSDLKNLFEESSVFGFDSKNNEHLRVIDLEGIDALKSLYPFSPKLKNVASGGVYETISFLTIHSDAYNYLFPLELLKKVSHSSEIRISKNQHQNMLGYTELENRVTAVFDLSVVLGGNDISQRNYIVFFEINEIQAALAVPDINRISISRNLIHKDVKGDHAAKFQNVSAAKIFCSEKIYYQIDTGDLKERFLELSK